MRSKINYCYLLSIFCPIKISQTTVLLGVTMGTSNSSHPMASCTNQVIPQTNQSQKSANLNSWSSNTPAYRTTPQQMNWKKVSENNVNSSHFYALSMFFGSTHSKLKLQAIGISISAIICQSAEFSLNTHAHQKQQYYWKNGE